MTTSNAAHRRRRAVIIGGSMSGLFAAAFLRKIGWEADVFERSTVELVGRGAGITTHPELLEALELSGAGTSNLGVEVEKRITIDRQGRIVGERPLRQILTSWDRLQRLLRRTIPPQHYHLGANFEGFDTDSSSVVVRFAGGRTERADLLIAGDGVRSSVRSVVAPEVAPIYAGYYIWRGAPNEADLAPEMLAGTYRHFTFYLPERQQVIGYPIAGFNDDLRPGHRRYNFIWYRVGDARELKQMCVDVHGTQHEYSVPPPLIRPDLIAAMRAEAEAIMPPPLLDALRKIDRPFFTPIYDFSSPRLVSGRVVLVGDAGSTSRPHMGFGVAKAGGDAQALAKHLHAFGDIDTALSRYDAERQPIGERIMLHGRKLGTFLGVDLKTDEDRAMSRLLQTHDGQMDWIAVPNFLNS